MDTLLYAELDRAEAQGLAARHLAGYDDGELYLQYRVAESLAFDDGRLKTASFDTLRGFGLRAVAGETTGFAHASEITAAAIARAAATLALVSRPGGPPAPPPAGTNRRLYGDTNPLEAVPFERKVALLEAIDAAARARDPRVTQVSVSLAASFTLVDILRADGHAVRDIRPLVRLNVTIVAEARGRRESGTFGLGGRTGPEHLLDEAVWGEAIDRALEAALLNLEAREAPAGEMPVVLGPGWPGILLHEAVGHGLEGDFNRKGTSIFAGRIGERVAAPGVTVVDDGTLPGRRGSLSVDDEGTPTSRTTLIEDGILKGYLHDRLNARLMGAHPTGNGRRESYAHPPMPRMTNTFLEGGREEPAAILARVKRGLFARSFGGGQVDIVSGKFVFTCTEAWLVEDGRLVHPVKGATLIGHGPTVMQHIEAIGNDFALDPGIGTCGKAGQSVPAGVGQPTLLVGRLTVGGTA
ncbi:metalloprotease TldD [Thermaurantiacus sp.]